MNITELCANCKQNSSCTMCWKTSNKRCPHFIQKTNADRIRAMSDEELAKFIPDWSYTGSCKCDEQSYVDCNNECEKCVLEWLKQPAEE